ncbi:MAG TPA: GAF domain-containing protein, partial [Candidatus Kapabacteria bacterium]|nr:GAF domain-containing protein [Candidatus Kapabacteria bacterium]
MDTDRISRLTNPELSLLSAAVVFLLLSVFVSDGFLRLVALVCGVLCGAGVYLLVARRLNERHVDSVVASKDNMPTEKRSGNFHVDPQTKRLVFDDYVLSFPPDDDETDEIVDADRGLDMGSFRKIEPKPHGAPPPVANPGDEVRIKVHRYQPAAPVATQAKIPEPQEQILLTEEKPSHKRKELNVPIGELFDFASEEQHNEPRNEFDSLLNRVLRTIREIVEAYTVVFFWVDKGSSRLIVEAKLSESDTFATRRKIDFGHDIVSQIASSGLPEVVTEISPNAELDLLGYYEQPNGVRSFAGVPIYFNHDVVAVLTLDAKAEDAYDARTIKVLGHFAKIVSGLIRGYTDKYDLHLSARAVHAVEKLRSALPPHTATSEKIARALLGVAEDVVDWEWASVAMFDNASKDWTLVYIDARRNQPYVESKQKIDLQHSVAGNVIRSGQPMVVNDVSDHIRFHPDERSYAEGSFLCLPICTPLRSYGALSIEHPAK